MSIPRWFRFVVMLIPVAALLFAPAGCDDGKSGGSSDRPADKAPQKTAR